MLRRTNSLGTAASIQACSQSGTNSGALAPSRSFQRRPQTAPAPAPRVSTAAFLASVIPSVTSGLVCGLIIFVFCCVYSEMIFNQSGLPKSLETAVPLGVAMHVLATLIGSVAFAHSSGCKAIMGGPDSAHARQISMEYSQNCHLTASCPSLASQSTLWSSSPRQPQAS